jgi:hypothetical protein
MWNPEAERKPYMRSMMPVMTWNVNLRNFVFIIALTLVIAPAEGAETTVTGDARFFQFFYLGDLPGGRNHSEFGVGRLKVDSIWTDELKFEVHGVLQMISPAENSGASIATGNTRRYFDLEYEFTVGDDVAGVLELDRLNVQWDRPSFRLVVGRQTMTWGVNYFWPVLDLFAPFAPERIDREYKPGIDAVRLTVPVGDFSEIEVVTAGQGERFPEDFSLASLGRFNRGSADIGYMGGRFHTDTVLGGFVTSDAFGTGLRAEAAFTKSGDPRDAEIDREQFLRASGGIDRQITAYLNLTIEVHFNGFGAKTPKGYRRIAEADRVQRGEVTSLGRYYTGVSLGWQAHPLFTFSGAFLTNWEDPSMLLQTTGEFSATQNIYVQVGGFYGFGKGLDDDDELQSEYGFIPPTLWWAFRVYF